MADSRSERPTNAATSPRRSPTPDARQRDADRSRERLLAAALEEFSARGYNGSRVADIAARAGLNPQLISYYFGGKAGLYAALSERWLQKETALTADSGSLQDVVAAYLRAAFDDLRMARLLLWQGLEADTDDQGDDGAALPEDSREDLGDLQRRQASGEIAADLEPDLLQLALMGATIAPIALPRVTRRLTGLDPADPALQERYAELLRRLVGHLATTRDTPGRST